jgi:4-amino-4-deoxy-L-arabinose transferase-like glycosyltransferase
MAAESQRSAVAAAEPRSDRWARSAGRAATWPVTLGLFLLALAPRAFAGNFLTVDEAYHWLGRVERFVVALRGGDFAGTNLIGHPGVTTLWLGALGSLLHEWAASLGLATPESHDARLALLRLPIALATALCVALAYPLLRRLLGAHVALLATLFMAGEPFLVAHSQLLHLDALLTSFMLLSLLAALVATNDRPPTTDDRQPMTDRRRAPLQPPPVVWRWWVASGAAGGLALLTKSPAVLLAPTVLLILVSALGLRLPDWRDRSRLASHLRRGVPAMLAWAGVAAAVWFALWPAAWVDPAGAVGRVALQASADGGSPHGWGNYFLGRAVDDPGPLFYPATVAFRLAPWTMVGLIALAGLALYELRRRNTPGKPPEALGPAPATARRALLLLALFALGFAVALSIPPKKFDRYVLPVYPALDILAAAGLVWIVDCRLQIAEWLRRRSTFHLRLVKTSAVELLVWPLIVGTLALNLALHHPYPLAYFNPLLGGPVAARVVPVGWGEGYEQAGAYIAAQPNGADRPVASRYEPVLGPYAPAGAAPLAWWQIPGRVDYAVVYIDQVQRDDKPETFLPLLEREPVHTVRINGIDYAYVYQIPPPVAVPLGADFGAAIRLRGYGLDTSAVRSSGGVTLTLEWEALGAPQADYTLFAHVFDATGRRVGQVDVPPGGERAPSSGWERGHYISLVQRIPLDPALPAGEYRVAIGLYHPATFERLPLRAEPRSRIPEAGADALALDPFRLP